MSNKIKKINLIHSFIFFFFANIFCFSMFKFNLIVPSILCFLLVLIVGVSHGSLDHLKGKVLLTCLDRKTRKQALKDISINGFPGNDV